MLTFTSQTDLTSVHKGSSLHPSIFFHLSGAGSRGQLPEQGHPDFPTPDTSSSSSGRIPRHSEASRVTKSPCSVGHARNTSRRRRPGGIQNRCPSHLSWLLSMWRSSGSTPSSSQVTQLLTLSLRERPATLRRILFFQS